MALIEFDPPQRFVTGTVGPPGQRQFFLQVRGASRTMSFGIEKAQVHVLADKIDDILLVAAPDPETETTPDNEPLETPVDEEFRIGTMGLTWDETRGRLIIECHASGDAYDSADVIEQVEAGVPEIDPQDDPTQLVLRVVLEPETAREFVRRSERVVAAGRPPCPFCAAPLDPEGHLCPRANGYRR